MDFDRSVCDFHKIYQGLPLSLLITGGGFSFLDILKCPGSSRLLHNIVIPYSQESQQRIDDTVVNSCSVSAVNAFLEYLLKQSSDSPDMSYLSVTAALTTNRYRRGENRAFIAYFDPKTNTDAIWKIELFHPSPNCFASETVNGEPAPVWLRRQEDQIVSLCVMSILTERFDLFPPMLNDSYRRNITEDEETKETFTRVA